MSAARAVLAPTSVDELVEAVRSTAHVVPVGAGTKARLASVDARFVPLSLTGLRGITEYEPSEFTFTALAGTPVRQVMAALAERGQYLPFDPLFAQSGATLGGMVAAGFAGPGRVRYGGVRDFLLGMRIVDGQGRLLRVGGRVVKNAAGFDVPKFLVGSAGRFGVIAELTFKVFPRPPASRTLRLEASDGAAKARLLGTLATRRWEFNALDAAVGEAAVFARLAGPAEAMDLLAADVLAHHAGAAMTAGDASYLWQSVVDVRWAHGAGTLIAVPSSPARLAEVITFIQAIPGARGWVTGGGALVLISVPADVALPELPWPGATLRGAAPVWRGPRTCFEIMNAVKQALDPNGRFPGLDD